MFRVNLCLISSMLSVILLLPAFCPAETIPIGSGSYSTEWPDYGGHFERQNEYTGWVSTGYGPPLTIFKTNNVNQPMPTNDWWSSVAWLRYSSELWSIPMAYKFTAQGLEAMGTFYKSGTTPWYKPREHDYVGGFKSQELQGDVWVSQWSKDVLISGTGLSPEAARVDSFTDWSTDIKMTQADKSITAKLITASPYLYLTFENCSPVITLPDSNFDMQTKDGSYITDTYTGDTIRTYDSETTHAYGWFAPAGTIFSRSGTDINITLPEGQNWLVMGLLSLDGTNLSENHNTLYAYAYAWPNDTRVTWNYDRINSKVTLVYDVTTESKQYGQTTTVQGIYPHQYKHMQETYTGIEYQTHRGYVKTLAGNSFTVNLTFHGFLPYFPVPESGGFDRSTMVNYLTDRVNTPIQSNPEIAFDHNDQPNSYEDYNTYWAGRYMNVMARLIPIANILDDSSKDFFKASVEGSLTDWLKVNSEHNEVANPNVDLDKYFVYLSDWGGLIGFRPGFGSEHFTDHHFHNGYFVYAASILSLFDPAFAENYGGMIDLLIKEYASDLRPSDLPDPSTAQFPFLRSMDLYHGHSWADGIGHDGWRNRGNNQESVSEALNSVAAIALWGAATGQENLIDLGVVLHSLEYSAAREYWYDIDRDIYDHSVYNTTYVTSLLFGDQATNQIWFGEEPEWKHGILYLPFTPSSLYLGLNPTFVQNDYQALLNETGGINDWCDVIGMYRAFYDPAGAVTDFNDTQDAQHAGDWGYTYFFIHSLNNFGQVKSSVTADIPFYAVFDKSGTTNYMAYNHTDAPVTVHFSDGYQMDVPAKELTSTVGQVKPVPNGPPVISGLPDQILDEDTS
ncbi:hypothetical protein KA005_41690, partial [bacterium]|nr:hypothetical protein [bacterium]